MVYRPPTHGMSTSYQWYIDLPSPWYIDPLPMVYRLPTNGISTPYPWYIDPYLWYIESLQMEYRPSYPCNIDPLPMLYRPSLRMVS